MLLDLGRADEAQGVYEKLLSGKLDPRLRFLAHEGLGYALEKKGKLSEAQATFAKLGGDAASLGGFYKDRARYHEARLTELQGNPTEAARIYHEVLDKNPTTSLRDEISNRLASARAEVSPGVRLGAVALATVWLRRRLRRGHGAPDGRRRHAASPGGHPADRLAHDAARPRPVRAVPGGVRVGRAGATDVW